MAVEESGGPGVELGGSFGVDGVARFAGADLEMGHVLMSELEVGVEALLPMADDE